MNDLNDDAVEYMAALLKAQGVSVATVSDGWVFTFSREKLLSILAGNPDAKNIAIFVKSSESQVKN